MKVLVVGAGFAGACIARKLAEHGHIVHVIDKRNHIGGNAYDEINSQNERIHVYGPHLLHGSLDSVAIQWLSRFTDWIPYEHRVLAQLRDGRFTPLPVNATTLEDIFQIRLETDDDAKQFLESLQVPCTQITNSDDVFLASVGEKLSDIFFRPYTMKMWGLDPKEIEAAVGKRIPVRYNRDDRYFTDTFQKLPKLGYTNLFANMLNHKNISLELGKEFKHELLDGYDHSFLSLPIDRFFDCKYGKLPYRSIKFEHKLSKLSQPSVTVNFTDTSKYTRTTQWDLLPNSSRSQTGFSTQTLEIPCSPEENNDEYYYPVRNSHSLSAYNRYLDEAKSIKNITFCGRAGLFQYLDMVPAVNIHLAMAQRFAEMSL
jgi:UDP-galactopyranose mutase